MKLRWTIAVAILTIAVAACGGGGSSSSPSGVLPGGSGSGGTSVTGPTSAPSGAGGATTQSNQTVTLSIVIPKKTTQSLGRSAQYIPSNTQSMTLTLQSVNGTPQTGTAQGPFNLSAPTPTNPNPNCTAITTGLSCSFSISAPVGTDIFTANTFSSANGTNPLGSGAIEITVTANARNTASLTLTGPVASVQVFSTALLTNGNPEPQPSILEDSLRRAPASKVRATAASSRHALQLTTPSPAPTVAPAATSARVFVIALDAAGNQIINPTTFDIPITLTLGLSGTPPSLVTLSVAYAGLSSTDSGTASTSADGGTITIYAPTDQVTMSISPSATNGTATYAPQLTATYTPQGGSATTTAPLAFTVLAFPASAFYTATETFPALNITTPATMVESIANIGTLASSGTVSLEGDIYGATINGFPSLNTTFWSCTIGTSDPSYSYFYCNTNSGQNLAAKSTAPPINVSITPAVSGPGSLEYYNYLNVGNNLYIQNYDYVDVSGTATPVPVPTAYLNIAVNGPAPAPTPTLFTNDQDVYALTVTNNGAATTAAFAITETLPGSFSYVGSSGANWTCSVSGTTLTCPYGGSLAANASTSTLNLTLSPGNGDAFSSPMNSFSVTGGGGAVGPAAALQLAVQPALQFTNSAFSGTPFTFVPATTSTNTAIVDFTSALSPQNGTVTLQSFYATSGRTSPSITTVSDGCYPSVTASPNPIATNMPLPLAASYNVPISLGATGNAGPCTIGITDQYGSSAAVTIQSESTTLTVNGKARHK